jgi:tetratricopeptide (TPR) repeat protein
MSEPIDTARLLELLRINQERLAYNLKRRSVLGADAPYSLAVEIEDARAEIGRIETELRNRGVRVPNRADAAPAAQVATVDPGLEEPPASPDTNVSDSATMQVATSSMASPQSQADAEPIATTPDGGTSAERKPAQKKTSRAQTWIEQILPVLIGLAVLGFIGWNGFTRDEQAATSFQQGMLRLQRGATDLAIADFSRAISLKSDYADAYFHRGLAYKARAEQYSGLRLDDEARDQFAEAVKDFNKAIDLGQIASEVYYNRGLALRGQQQFAAAVDDLNLAIERGLRTAEAYYNRGLALMDKGDIHVAIGDFTQAITLKADYAEAYYNRALAYNRQARSDLARADLEKVLALPSNTTLRQQAEEQIKTLTQK